MKKLIFISALIMFTISAFGQQQKVKFFLKDGSFKEYFISNIDSMTFKITSDSLKLVFKDSLTGNKDSIDLTKIRKVEFADSSRLAFFFKDTTVFKKFTDVDSMVFIQPKLPESGSIKIGNQFWMAKNLNVATYRNGDSIPQVTDSTVWSGLTTGAWCYYVNNTDNGMVYGKLYNWYAVNDSRGLAPSGWKIPSEADWTELVAYLGGENTAGGTMKETGFTHWQNPNTGATDNSKFTALPAGFRSNYKGEFNLMGTYAVWWSLTVYDAAFSKSLYLTNTSTNAKLFLNNKKDGLSVRCIQE